MRRAISPRFATRTLANTLRILSTDELRRPTDRRARYLRADRRRVVRGLVLGPRLLGNRCLLRSDGDGLVRREDRAPHRPYLAPGLAPRPGGGQAARGRDA